MINLTGVHRMLIEMKKNDDAPGWTPGGRELYGRSTLWYSFVRSSLPHPGAYTLCLLYDVKYKSKGQRMRGCKNC